MWIDGEVRPDIRVAFRGAFTTDAAGDVTVRHLAASWANVWLDGVHVGEGPDRFHPDDPHHQVVTAHLDAGEHLLAVEVHHHGVPTQQLVEIDPFLWCEVVGHGAGPVPVRWRARLLDDNVPAVRRINPNLAWVEWRDHAKLLPGWESASFDEDDAWTTPVEVVRPIGRIAPPDAHPPRWLPVDPTLVGDGTYANRYATIFDDPPLTVVRRDLQPTELQPNGRWFRFDLGCVHLGRPAVTIDAPAGASVELVYGEALHDGRVLPWLSLSNGPSANMDHYLAPGGTATFGPSAPRGMRFFEVHVLAPPADVRLIEARFTERTYFSEPEGSFSCGDERLEAVWRAGLRTLRSCAEDAITDCPTRERGQWVGDAAVGLETASVGWPDLRLVPRALRHAALTLHESGIVAGNSPGGKRWHLSSFSCIWASTVWRHFRHTGDRALLADLLPAARGNIAALEAHLGADGLDRLLPWGFIDWGYVTNDGPSDVALNLLFVAALEDCARWADVLGEPDGDGWRATASTLRSTTAAWMAGRTWEDIGYHVTALALRLGLVPHEHERAAVEAMKAHILRCFPNDPTAPQLGTPEMNHRQVITPYFSHWAFPPLLDRGETDFVADQWRSCWGWMLDRGHRTLLEVFDERWSHSHQWSAAPTWQLSRFVLGLQPRYDVAPRTFDVVHRPGSIAAATGVLPAKGGPLRVRWEQPALSIEVDAPVTLRFEDGTNEEVVTSWTGEPPGRPA